MSIYLWNLYSTPSRYLLRSAPSPGLGKKEGPKQTIKRAQKVALVAQKVEARKNSKNAVQIHVCAEDECSAGRKGKHSGMCSMACRNSSCCILGREDGTFFYLCITSVSDF